MTPVAKKDASDAAPVLSMPLNTGTTSQQAEPKSPCELALQFSSDTAYQDVDPLLREDLSDFQNTIVGDML